MRLLICTQAVDSNDSDLGFFVRWIYEFAKKCDHVTVICLRKGVFALPENVEVIALPARNKLLRAFEVCSISFGLRREYDAVFVHMNPEYIVAAGWLWRLLHKKIALWYVHRSVHVLLRIATMFATTVLSASPESFRLTTSKLKILGHGIDTDFFSPGTQPRGAHLLSAGRLAKSKHHDLVIRAAAHAGRKLRIAGEGPERESLQKLAKNLGADVEFLGGLTQAQMRDEYRSAAHFIHASETGSLDKVVLEAAACDCDVITTVEWLHTYFPVHIVSTAPNEIAHAVAQGARGSPDRVEIIRKHHSLPRLIERIMSYYGES